MSTSTLASVVAEHGFKLSNEQLDLLDAYCQTLWKHNESINLTRHTDYEKFVTRDLCDSVALERLIDEDKEVLDVGTGGGVPGIVLAILRPDLQVSLCDSVGKKAKLVDEIVAELNLPIPVYHARAEEILDEFRFDHLVARAVGPLWKICHWFKDHWHSFDSLLAIKGPKWVDERGEARHRGVLANVDLRKLVSYPMYGTDSESVILHLGRRRPS